MLKGSTERQADHQIDALFLDRWSPRAMSGQSISEGDLMTLLEAARWAPSSYNAQPWRILYARRDDEHWARFFSLLSEGNQLWAHRAAALLVFISNTRDQRGNHSKTHSFDAGAAWENLALQACRSGLIAHGMQGFDYERTRQELSIPNHFLVEAMAAIGMPGNVEDLPEALRARERPSPRYAITQIACAGTCTFE